MSAVSARFASATSRLAGVFGDPATFRGVPVTVMFDMSPKPERLPPNMLDLDDGVQAVIITVQSSAVASAPRVGEYFETQTHQYRIESGIRDLGHAYELPCIATPIT